MGVGTAFVTGRPLSAQVNVRAMAEVVQAMITGGQAIEDGMWLRMQAEATCLTSREYAALEVLRTRIRDGMSLLQGASTATWYG